MLYILLFAADDGIMVPLKLRKHYYQVLSLLCDFLRFVSIYQEKRNLRRKPLWVLGASELRRYRQTITLSTPMSWWQLSLKMVEFLWRGWILSDSDESSPLTFVCLHGFHMDSWEHHQMIFWFNTIRILIRISPSVDYMHWKMCGAHLYSISNS